jgi:hypothetical protein
MSEKISIVRRLRLEANALGEFQAYASREYQRLLLDAADEIERLGKERDEFENNAIGESTAREMALNVMYNDAMTVIERLKKERDEARRKCRLLLLGQDVLRGVRDLPAPPDDLVTIVPVPRKEDGK